MPLSGVNMYVDDYKENHQKSGKNVVKVLSGN